MKLRNTFSNCKEKTCSDLSRVFLREINFSKEDTLEKVKYDLQEMYVSRVWLLFGSNNRIDWKCLQVAHSKKDVRGEIEEVVDFLFCDAEQSLEGISFTNSTFYEEVCPKVAKQEYREVLYKKIGCEYKYFRICFLDVDMYLGTKLDNGINETDTDRIVQICKNQYAEAKIAYQTLSVYWRNYRSGIDGQTIDYIVKHFKEFEM